MSAQAGAIHTTASPPLSHEQLEELVDQAANFNLFAAPGGRGRGAIRAQRDGGAAVIGVETNQPVRRFDIDLQTPSEGSGVQAINLVGPPNGDLSMRLMFIPHDYAALPNVEPAAEPLNRSVTQRFAIQNFTLSFAGGQTGLRAFGTGRTFPIAVNGVPKLIIAGIANITGGFGQFSRREGNLTLCGELTAEYSYLGHVMIRILDADGGLRSPNRFPLSSPETPPDPSATFLTWIGHKGRGGGEENTFSIGPDGQVRGLNIPVESRRVNVFFEFDNKFRASNLHIGEVVGREVGFGKGSQPGNDPAGTGLRPFEFEGVSKYSFYAPDGRTVGTIVANVLEGRRFDVRLPAAPDQPALRFGFFGPIFLGTGCFAGVDGMLYGASGSIFNFPPGDHAISNWS
jgi:hypothetical protein